MNSGREGQEGDVPISQRVITEASQATIKSLLDALVELITNSDDSYRRLEEAGQETPGEIAVYVRRKRGGSVSRVEVTDLAEGMTLDRILEVLEFGADKSGFTEGKNIRGLFGKGLKEAIFALGSGRVESVRNGAVSAIEVWKDAKTGHHRWRVDKDGRSTEDSNGTRVSITVSNERVRSPKWKNLTAQVCTHFALRDICSSSARSVELTLEDDGTTRRNAIQYEKPGLSRVVATSVRVEGLDTVRILIDQAEEPLDFSNRDPCSIAGIVVKTQDIPLDNRLFGFENEEAARYFTGVVEVQAIAQELRAGEYGLLDPSRTGLDWRHQKAKRLHEAVERVLRQQIERKREELDSERRTATRQQFRHQLRDLCSLLNQIAEEELDDLPSFNRPGEPILDGLLIRPDVGYARPNERRRFSLYLPTVMAEGRDFPQVLITVEDMIGTIALSSERIALKPHPKDPTILMGRFHAWGQQEGDSCTFMARLMARSTLQEDIAELRVREPTPRPGPQPRGRGLFREIIFDDQTAHPIQRVSFGHGEVTIFLNFPSVRDYLGPGGEGMDSPQGSLMCAELVAETFSREIARRRIESGNVIVVQGGEIDTYNSEVDKLRQKHLRSIHGALVIAEG